MFYVNGGYGDQRAACGVISTTWDLAIKFRPPGSVLREHLYLRRHLAGPQVYFSKDKKCSEDSFGLKGVRDRLKGDGIQVLTPWWLCHPPQCRAVCGLNTSDRCDFVRRNPDCRSEGGYLDYLKGVFCYFRPNLLPLAITLYVSLGPGTLVTGHVFVEGRNSFLLFWSPPGFLAPLPLSDPGSHGGQVVSVAWACVQLIDGKMQS